MNFFCGPLKLKLSSKTQYQQPFGDGISRRDFHRQIAVGGDGVIVACCAGDSLF